MSPRPLAAFLAAAAMLGLAPGFALAGAQQYEALSASVRASLAKAVTDRQFARLEDPESRAWVRAMLGRMHERVRDERLARELLEMVRYEALRAGLEPRLVLAVIDVESGFRKYAVSTAGARGYMQVMPFWVREIGMPGQNLFHARTNLRYGCVILRHYLQVENGNLANALGRYNGSLGRPEYPQRVLRAMDARWTSAGA
ncbi:MAG TPA: transglycosylase SLT domain-containing protein [Usitatibacteraceae bacterium]|jgi:soluble lytic murein transglycosylase-like protein|nr:transglycosylase SLT domain-containing protein [Usitatibacteraceae bacterium]